MGLPVVLLVEDEHMLVQTYLRLLDSDQYEVVVARSFTEACTVVDTVSDRLRLLLTDQHLPDGLGTVLAKVLLEEFQDLQILILSGDSLEGLPYEVIEKPFRMDHLQERVLALATLVPL